MYEYKYKEFVDDVELLYKKTKSYEPDIILAVARGGVTLGHFLAEKFKLRDLYTLNSVHYDDTKKLDSVKIFNIPHIPKYKKVLIVDEIIDTGESMVEILKVLKKKFPTVNFKIAVIFYKKEGKITPDFKCKEAHAWIEFFWSKH
jgi:xanthine phosphoribosyltransferase